MKKNKKPKIMDLEEKIYLICYSKPHYKTEIAELIYGEDTQRYPKITGKAGFISQMEKTGKLKEDNLTLKQMKTFDKRAKKRCYYISNISPVYNYMISTLEQKKITLNQKENNEILQLLDSNEFREMVESAFPIEGLFIESRRKNISIDPEYIISYLFFHYAGIFYAIKSILEKMKMPEKDLLSIWDVKSSEKNYKKDMITKFQNIDNNGNIAAAMSLKNMSFGKALEMNNFNKRFLKLDRSLLEKLMKTDLGFKRDPSLILTLFELLYQKNVDIK